MTSFLYLAKSAAEVCEERDLAIEYLRKIAQVDPDGGFINHRAYAEEALARLEAMAVRDAYGRPITEPTR